METKRDQVGQRLRQAPERERLVRAYEESGLTQKEFAKQEELNYTTFSGWVRKQRTERPRSGTLLLAGGANEKPTPAVITGVIVANAETGIRLTWISIGSAATYTVSRAKHPDGPFSVIARDLTSPRYTDTTAKHGLLYTYTISAGSGLNSAVVYVKLSKSGSMTWWLR